MEQTIYSTPSDYPHAKFQYLEWGKFLGEFKTEIDKARARANLGIPDTYSFNWGNIGGNISRQQDLLDLINQVVAGNTQDYTNINTKVNQFETLLNNYSARLLSTETTTNNLKALTDAIDLQNIKSEILSIKINVAQNSTDIARLSDIDAGGETIDLVSLLTRVNTLESTVQSQSVIIGSKADSSILSTKADLSALNNLDSLVNTRIDTFASSISALETRVRTLEMATNTRTLVSISASQSTISATEGDNDKSVSITASFSDGSSTTVTEYTTFVSSNDSVASYNNNGYISINGVGSATITCSYGGQSTTITVNVIASSSPETQDIFYIGYCTSLNELFSNKYEKTQLNSIVWNSTNIPKQFEIISVGSSVNFYVAAPVKYTNVSISSGGLPAGSQMASTPSANNTTYKVYKISGVTNYDSDYTITIS